MLIEKLLIFASVAVTMHVESNRSLGVRASKTANAAKGKVYPDRFFSSTFCLSEFPSVPKLTPTLHLFATVVASKTPRSDYFAIV